MYSNGVLPIHIFIWLIVKQSNLNSFDISSISDDVFYFELKSNNAILFKLET